LAETGVPGSGSVSVEVEGPITETSRQTPAERKFNGEIRVSSVYVHPGRRAVRPERVQSLAESIRDIGLLTPITVRADGRLIAGAHRLEAYRLLGRDTIPCRVAPMDGELWEQALRDGNTHLVDELQEIDENLQREELTALAQGEAIARRKVIYETLHPETVSVRERGGPGRGRQNERHHVAGFATDTAQRAGVTERTVQRSALIGSMPAEVRDAVRNTPLADNQQELLKLAREAKRDPAQAVRIAEAARDTQAKRVTDARSVVRRETISETAQTVALPTGAQIITGDFREVMAEMETDSVDMVFTDPPYDRAAVPMYEDLARLSARVLRPGGSLLCYAGHYALPDLFALMTPHLKFWWPIALFYSGAARRLPGKFVFIEWKPVLWFVKEFRAGERLVSDSFRCQQAPEKVLHEWEQGQAEAEYYIDTITEPGALVLDPFCGSGTTCAAALAKGRRTIGIEVDQNRAAVARGRLGGGAGA